MNRREEIEYIKSNISIVDLASKCGFTPVRKGKYYSLKEHDSVIIDTNKNCYWQNSVPALGNGIGQGGSVIDFAINLGRMDYVDAIKMFKDDLNIANNSTFTPIKRENKKNKPINKDKRLELPEADDNNKKVYAYLTKTRSITPEVVNDLIKSKKLYQDLKGNCVFVGYDFQNSSKPVFAIKRGTNTYKPFYGDVSGSDYSKCWFVDFQADTLCITESVIDALSVMTLSGEEYKKYDYLALAGVGKWEAIKSYLDNKKYKLVIISLDNDDTGVEATQIISNYIESNYQGQRIMKVLPPKEHGKDWNDVLIKKYK